VPSLRRALGGPLTGLEIREPRLAEEPKHRRRTVLISKEEGGHLARLALKEDEAEKGLDHEDALANAPSRESGAFRTPAVV